MQNSLDELLTRVWWAYDPTDAWPGQAYHWFNLLEGGAWFVIAALVLRRHYRCRNSWLEVLYAVAFVVFGLSDFREAYRLQTWLILGKGMILVVILTLRRHLIRRYYTDSRTF